MCDVHDMQLGAALYCACVLCLPCAGCSPLEAMLLLLRAAAGPHPEVSPVLLERLDDVTVLRCVTGGSTSHITHRHTRDITLHALLISGSRGRDPESLSGSCNEGCEMHVRAACVHAAFTENARISDGLACCNHVMYHRSHWDGHLWYKYDGLMSIGPDYKKIDWLMVSVVGLYRLHGPDGCQICSDPPPNDPITLLGHLDDRRAMCTCTAEQRGCGAHRVDHSGTSQQYNVLGHDGP
jgi:hypothetical protein